MFTRLLEIFHAPHSTVKNIKSKGIYQLKIHRRAKQLKSRLILFNVVCGQDFFGILEMMNIVLK